MDPTVASNWTVGTLVTEDTPSLKVSAPTPYRRIALMIFMDPTVASNWTVGTLVTEDTPSLKVSAPPPYRYSPVFAGESH